VTAHPQSLSPTLSAFNPKNRSDTHANEHAGGSFVYLHRVHRKAHAAELCKRANSLNRLNEIACNSGLTEQQERRKQNLQTRIKAALERAGLVLNHFNNDPRGYAVYLDLHDGSYNSFGGRECGYGIGR
jgi:hypothetical protein